MSRRWWLALAASIVFVASLEASNPLPPLPQIQFAPQAEGWSYLEYRASKLFLTATSKIELAKASAEETRATLLASTEGTPRPVDGNLLRISLETSFAGRRSTEDIWFDGDSGSALQRRKTRHRRAKSYIKTSRFQQEGTAWERLSPAEGEADKPSEVWSKRQQKWFPLPPGQGAGTRNDCLHIADPIQLFYLLSAFPWQSEPEGFQLCIFSRDTYSLLSASVAAREPLETCYSINGAEAIEETVETLHLNIEAQVLPGQAEPRAFELMGMEGDVDIYLDPKSGIPVQISGDLSSLGRVDVKLVALQH